MIDIDALLPSKISSELLPSEKLAVIESRHEVLDLVKDLRRHVGLLTIERLQRYLSPLEFQQLKLCKVEATPLAEIMQSVSESKGYSTISDMLEEEERKARSAAKHDGVYIDMVTGMTQSDNYDKAEQVLQDAFARHVEKK